MFQQNSTSEDQIENSSLSESPEASSEAKKLKFIKRSSLPENFAENIMDYEFKIDEGDFTMEDVDTLIYLYSQGIEYYEGVDEAKHSNFYKRTLRLINKPSVFALMKNPKKESSKEENLVDKNKIQTPEKREKSKTVTSHDSFETPKRKQLEMDVLLLQKEKEQTHLIKNHHKDSSAKSELIHNDIAQQKKNLEIRLLKRRMHKGKENGSMSQTFASIGIEEGTNEEISCIMSKAVSGMKDNSWNDEDSSLLKEFHSTKDKTNTTDDYFCEDEKLEE